MAKMVCLFAYMYQKLYGTTGTFGTLSKQKSALKALKTVILSTKYR